MTATGHIRGRAAWFDNDAYIWRWSDTDEPASGWSGGPERPCPACGLTADPNDGVDGADPCMGVVAGVSGACCGHGIESGYITWLKET